MPVNYYPQKSEAELLAILARLQKRQTEGAITDVQAAGVRTQKMVGGGNSRVEIEILRVLYALYLVDPAEYDDPYASRIRMTRVRYTFS